MPKTLDQIVCLMLDITLWTGRKKLELSDLKNVDRSQIPPDKLASLGSKRIVDPDNLKIFNTLKKRAERACKAVGSRLLGGYAIPESRLNELVGELEGIRAEFDQARQEFVQSYDNAVEEWVKVNPEWEVSIRSAIDPLSTIQRQIRYSYQAFKVEELGGSFAPDAQKGLQEVVAGLGGQLLHEIHQQAKAAWEQSYAGKSEVGQKALRPLAAMADKLEGLSFVDGRVSTMVENIRDCLQAMPKSGVISGQHFNAVAGVLSMLQDPRGIVRQQTQDWSLPKPPPREEKEPDLFGVATQETPGKDQTVPKAGVVAQKPATALTSGCTW